MSLKHSLQTGFFKSLFALLEEFSISKWFTKAIFVHDQT